jgi:hypothetical protein
MERVEGFATVGADETRLVIFSASGTDDLAEEGRNMSCEASQRAEMCSPVRQHRPACRIFCIAEQKTKIRGALLGMLEVWAARESPWLVDLKGCLDTH